MTRIDKHNQEVFNEGMNKAKKLIYDHIFSILAKACDDLVIDAVKEREYGDFTGNTATSYACGLYIDGILSYMSLSADRMKAPIRVKVSKGETVFLSPDYGGHNRSFTGSVKTDGKYGYETSVSFLKSYKSNVQKGFEIVMCTGTEYSNYIESSRNLNVLTETFLNAKNIISSNLKPM